MRYIVVDSKSCGFCIYPPGATFGPRNALDYEIVWLESGCARWQCNEKSYKVNTDSVLITKPGSTEFFEWDTQGQTGHYYIHFNFDKTNSPKIAELEHPEKWPFVQQLPENNILKPMLMNILWLIKNGYKDKDPLLQGMLQQVLIVFARGIFEVEQVMPNDLPPAIERVFEHIYKKWNTFPLSKTELPELASKAHISVTHLCRLFNDTFKMSPMQVLGLIRLKRAAALLVRTNYPIKEIANLTGFESQYHFSRSFKKAYGINPTTYRRDSIAGQKLPISSVIVKRF